MESTDSSNVKFTETMDWFVSNWGHPAAERAESTYGPVAGGKVLFLLSTAAFMDMGASVDEALEMGELAALKFSTCRDMKASWLGWIRTAALDDAFKAEFQKPH